MGSSSRIFLMIFVAQLLLITGAEVSHGNQTWNIIDVSFEMLEMMKNIFELTKNVNKLQKTNQALSSDVQQLQNANQALSSDVQQLHQTNQALSSDLQQLKNTTVHITDTMIQGSQGGGIYTQWGRFNCTNNNTELVYSGIAGGSFYTHTGGAAEYVCLPKVPSYPDNVTPSYPYNGYLYGAEYQQSSLNNHDVPCAVCRSRLNNIVMIPAIYKCYNGWTQQYNGTLASGYYKHEAASQYVCLDAHPEVRTGGQVDQNGKLFYPVKASCAYNLPCPPYKSDKVVSCVVCAK